MSLGGKIYDIFFKKSSTYILTLVVGSFAFERFSDGLADNIFDSINRGKQWKDIKHLYIKKEDEASE